MLHFHKASSWMSGTPMIASRTTARGVGDPVVSTRRARHVRTRLTLPKCNRWTRAPTTPRIE
jgi:hypothetical protein